MSANSDPYKVVIKTLDKLRSLQREREAELGKKSLPSKREIAMHAALQTSIKVLQNHQKKINQNDTETN